MRGKPARRGGAAVPPFPLRRIFGATLLTIVASALVLDAAVAQTPSPTPTEPAAEASPSPSASASPSPTPSPSPSPSPRSPTARAQRAQTEPQAAPVRALGAATVAVSAIDDEFSPRSVTIAAGDTVRWSNDGDNVHTVTSDEGAFDSGTLEAGAAFSFTFGEPGTYPYYCQVHGAAGGVGMAGTIEVTGATEEPADPAATEEDSQVVSPQGLPATGGGALPWLAVALAAIGAGGAMLVAVRGK